MKLSPLVVGGKHHMEDLPPGVEFDGRTRELTFGEDARPGRFAATYVGRAGGLQATVQVTVEHTPEPE